MSNLIPRSKVWDIIVDKKIRCTEDVRLFADYIADIPTVDAIDISVLDDIKSEIQKAKEFSIDCDDKSDLGIALDIIDRYIKKEN